MDKILENSKKIKLQHKDISKVIFWLQLSNYLPVGRIQEWIIIKKVKPLLQKIIYDTFETDIESLLCSENIDNMTKVEE